MNTTYDVIISGAGPVGLFLACELAQAQCSVLMLEKADDPISPLKQMPFGIRGLSAPTIAAFAQRGLLDQMEVPKRVKNPFGHVASAQAGHFAGIPFFYGDIDSSPWPAPASLISEMAETEAVLTRRALSLGVEILRGVAVSGVAQDAQGVAVQAGDRAFAGRWLVGCDGARSVVRKAGGFEFDGTEPEFTGYTMKADIADPEQLKPGRNITPAGMYFQSQPGYFAMQDFDAGAFHQTGQPVSLEHAQTVLRRVSHTDVTISALHIATTWTDRARQATHYRNGRILLAGDAAHIHSPLGGQGLNLGIGDAVNLGWKLAATIRGNAAEGLLDTYHAERHPVGARVLDWSRAQVAVMRPSPEGRALRAIFTDLLKTRDGATYVASRVWGIAVKD
nr:FAD-dependent monooxygenase [uncultured Duganella sp.]